MTTKKQKQLFKKYPKIFSSKDKPMTQTCMCWGIECGDGWFDIIDSLCFSIQSYCDQDEYLPKHGSFVSFMYQLWNDTAWHQILRPISSWWFLNRESVRVPDMYPSDCANAKRYDAQWKKYSMFEQRWHLKVPLIRTGRKQHPQITFEQVKEKYGGLRVDTHPCDSYVAGLVRMAESMSYKVCETCGTTKGVIHTKGWTSTTCKICNKKLKTIKIRDSE